MNTSNINKSRFMRYQILIFLSLVLAFAACEKDSTTEVVTFAQTTLSGETVTANFFGQLTNDQGIVVADAEVRIGNKQTTTDQEGLWSIDNTTVAKDQAFIQFAAGGHHKGSRTLFVDEGRRYEVDVQMLQHTGTETVDATTGGTVSVPESDALVTFSAGAFAKTDGTPYTGTVRVETAYLDPNESSTANRMPGDLRATTTAGESRLLITYGMVSVELFDDAGNELQLADGKTATISLPVTGEAANTAPETIPLWYFDEATAQWLEEGSATLQNGSYLGEVSHFTFWNCDIPTEYIRLCGTVIFEGVDSTIAANLQLIIQSEIWGSGYGYTNENGQFCGIVPANETLSFILQGDCDQPSYTITIGPYAIDTDLGTIVIPLALNLLTVVSGSANCDGTPLTSGAAYIYQNGSVVSTATINTDGTFSSSFVSCDSGDVSLEIRNYDNQSKSDQISFTRESIIQTGDIDACTQIFLTGSFELMLDGSLYTGQRCRFYQRNRVGQMQIIGNDFSFNGNMQNEPTFHLDLRDPNITETLAPFNSTIRDSFNTTILNLGGTISSTETTHFLEGLPISITSVPDTNSPYLTGSIGPGIITEKDDTGTIISTTTFELNFSAYSQF